MLGVLSATETSQKPIPCDAANDAPSDSLTCVYNIQIRKKLSGQLLIEKSNGLIKMGGGRKTENKSIN